MHVCSTLCATIREQMKQNLIILSVLVLLQMATSLIIFTVRPFRISVASAHAFLQHYRGQTEGLSDLCASPQSQGQWYPPSSHSLRAKSTLKNHPITYE